MVKDRSLDGVGFDFEHRIRLCPAMERFRIDAVDNRKSLLANIRHQTYRTQESRGIIDEVKKGRQTNETEQPGDEYEQLMDGCLSLVQASNREQKREHKQAHRVADDIVAQQRSGNDPRCVLPARDLYGYKERAEREDDDREAEGDDCIEQRFRAINPEPEKRQP